jgi:hypothetical protein
MILLLVNILPRLQANWWIFLPNTMMPLAVLVPINHMGTDYGCGFGFYGKSFLVIEIERRAIEWYRQNQNRG